MTQKILLPESAGDLTDTIARPDQEIERPVSPKQDFELSAAGLLVPKVKGLAKPDQDQTLVLLPSREQVTNLAAKNASETREKPEGNIAAFLYDPMAYLARKVVSEEHLGEQHKAEVENILLKMRLQYQEHSLESYDKAINRLEEVIAHGDYIGEPVYNEREQRHELITSRNARMKEAKELATQLAQVTKPIKPEDLIQREKNTVTYFDKYEGKQATREVSNPSIFEEVAVAMLEELSDPNIRKSYPEMQGVLQVLSETLREYRGRCEVNILDKAADKRIIQPEMPSATKICMEMLEIGATSPALRNSVYDLIEQLNIPGEQQEEVLHKMDTSHDLDHPLAFQLSLDLARNRPNCDFLRKQEARREELLAHLQGTGQECFDNFENLFSQTRGLVCAADPNKLKPGKVGVEIEFNTILGFQGNNEEYGKSLQVRFSQLISGYTIGSNQASGHQGFEARKDVEFLEHDLEHAQDTVTLRHALLDMPEQNFMSSLHLHFDLLRHPIPTTMGGYLEYGSRTLSRANSLPDETGDNVRSTNEIRGFVVPLCQLKGIQVARMEDAIEMLIRMSDIEPEPKGKIQIGEGTVSNWRQVVFGHVCQMYESPEIRLACLMALQDDQMLRGGTIESFLSSYDISLLDHLDPKAFPGTNRVPKGIKEDLSNRSRTKDLSITGLSNVLLLNPENNEIVREMLAMRMFYLDTLVPLSSRAFSFINSDQELMREYDKNVISWIYRREDVHPIYLEEWLKMVTQKPESFELSEGNKGEMLAGVLGSLRSGAFNYDENVLKDKVPKVINLLETYAGELEIQEAAREIKIQYWSAGIGSPSKSRDIFLANLNQFFERHHLEFSYGECMDYLGKDGDMLMDIHILESMFNSVTALSPDHLALWELYLNRISYVASGIYNWEFNKTKEQQEIFAKLIGKIEAAMDSDPQVYGKEREKLEYLKSIYSYDVRAEKEKVESIA